MKLRILLADTETDNLQNFKTYIRHATNDIKIVGAFSSPEDFRERVKACDPSLILADIRFFGAAVVQIIREIHEFFPDIRFIVYGSYNDTAYIQKVLEFGVIDYIYKPVKPAELERVLKHAEEVVLAIAREREQSDSLYSAYRLNMNLFKDHFLSNLIHGNLTNPFEIETGFRYFDVSISGDYTVLIVRIDHFRKIILTMDEREKQLFVYQTLAVVAEKTAEAQNGVAFLKNLNEIVVLVGGSAAPEQLVRFGSQLKEAVLLKTRQNVTVGIGRTYAHLTDVCVSYREADAALRYRAYFGYHTVIPIDFVEPENKITYRYPLTKEKILVYSAVTGEYEYCATLLDQIMGALETTDVLPPLLLPKIIMNIVIAINRYASEQNILSGTEFTAFFPTKAIFEIESVVEAKAYLSRCLQNFCGFIVGRRNEEKRVVAARAADYMQKRFSGAITVAETAFYAKTTTEFLSSAFRSVYKMSVSAYLTDLRVAKAKELILGGEPDETAGAIAGYKDTKTFREAFRKREGLHTHEFRAKEGL